MQTKSEVRPAIAADTITSHDTEVTGSVTRRAFVQGAALTGAVAGVAALSQPVSANQAERRLAKLSREIREKRRLSDRLSEEADELMELIGKRPKTPGESVAARLASFEAHPLHGEYKAKSDGSSEVYRQMLDLLAEALRLRPATTEDLAQQMDLFTEFWEPIGDIELEVSHAAPMLHWAGHLRRLTAEVQS